MDDTEATVRDQHPGGEKPRAIPAEYRNNPPRPIRISLRPIALIFVAAYLFFTVVYFYTRFTISLPTGKFKIYGYIILGVELLGVSSLLPYAFLLFLPTLSQKTQGLPVKANTEPEVDLTAEDPWFWVRVLVPCYKEPLDVVMNTVNAALDANLPPNCRRTVYLCDDGKMAEKELYVRQKKRNDLIYVTGRTRKPGEKNGKSNNLNNCLKNIIYKDYKDPSGEIPKADAQQIPMGEVIVVFDADMVCNKNFFCKILEVMVNDKTSLCLSPQSFTNIHADGDLFNNINLQFWEYVLPGSDTFGYVACTGTNFCIRARPLASVGFFPDYTITEDYALGMELAKAGYKGAYMNEYLAKGEAPDDVRNVFRQRSRWTKGHMEVFFGPRCPLFNWKLSLANKWLYTNGTWAYFATVITTPTFVLVPFISLAFGIHPVTITRRFAIVATIYYGCTWLVQNYCRSIPDNKSLWFSNISNHVLCFTYFKAIMNILMVKLGMKTGSGFKATVKAGGGGGVVMAVAQFAKTMSRKLSRTVSRALTNNKSAYKAQEDDHHRHQPTALPMIVQEQAPEKKKLCCGNKGDLEGTLDIYVLILSFLFSLATLLLGIWRWVEAGQMDAYVVLPMFWACYNVIPPYLFVHYLFSKGGSFRFACSLLRLLGTVFAALALMALYFTVPVEVNAPEAHRLSVDFMASGISGTPSSDIGSRFADVPQYKITRDIFTLTGKQGQNVQVDLSGGWFVNGASNIKWGFPTATTASLYAWALHEFKDGFEKTGTAAKMRASLRVAGDWLMAAHYDDDRIVAQVGDPQVDKNFWIPPNQIDATFNATGRPAFVLTNATGGADLMASYAAALAGISLVFRDADSAYAAETLRHAKEIYAMARSVENTTYCNTEYTGIACAHADVLVRRCFDQFNNTFGIPPSPPLPAGTPQPPSPPPPPRTGIVYRRNTLGADSEAHSAVAIDSSALFAEDAAPASDSYKQFTRRFLLQADPPPKDPPANDPPAKDPPAKDPPAKDPPAKDPPANDPPAKDPPAKDPPAKDPPAKDPPAKDPPAKDPPAKDPPAKDPPPKEDPPVEVPKPNPPSPPPSPPPPFSQPTNINIRCPAPSKEDGTLSIAYYYPSNSVYDDMAWAAALLSLAEPSSARKYQAEADTYLNAHWEKEWDSKNTSYYLPNYDNIGWAAAILRNDQEGGKSNLHSVVATDFLRAWLPGQKLTYKNKEDFDVNPVNNKKVKKGTIAVTPNATLPNALNAGMYAMIISKQYTGRQRQLIRCWSREQLRFALLRGGRDKSDKYSYVVGYGKKYPLNPQSRVAACDYKQGICDARTTLFFQRPNPITLYGALVFGPNDKMTEFPDVRDSDANRVGLEYNIGLTGLSAAFSSDEFTISNDQCAYGKGVYQDVLKKVRF